MSEKKELSMWERTEYDVISETETETELIGVIRLRNSGATVICHIPKHTPEEEEQLGAELTYALMQTAYTMQDISLFRSMEILPD